MSKESLPAESANYLAQPGKYCSTRRPMSECGNRMIEGGKQIIGKA